MKTLADLKRLEVGQELTLINSYFPGHKNINVKRKIIKRQTNAIQFEGGSWLYFPKSNEFKSTEKGFIILDEIIEKDENNQQIWDEKNNCPKKKTVELLEYELN